jgi:hypothetical protein
MTGFERLKRVFQQLSGCARELGLATLCGGGAAMAAALEMKNKPKEEDVRV